MLKWSKVIIERPKAIKDPNIADTKSTIIEHAKTSHKPPKTIKQPKKLSQVSVADNPLHSETIKCKNLLNEKSTKG